MSARHMAPPQGGTQGLRPVSFVLRGRKSWGPELLVRPRYTDTEAGAALSWVCLSVGMYPLPPPCEEGQVCLWRGFAAVERVEVLGDGPHVAAVQDERAELAVADFDGGARVWMVS